MKKTVAGTRFWEKDPSKIDLLENFIQQTLQSVDEVLVAVNSEADKTGAINLKVPGVYIFCVIPWGKFVPALNALISQARLRGADFLLSASTEVSFTPKQFSQLQEHMDENTLVVGAVMEGQNFKEGENVLGDGSTIPRNTFSLWNLEYLSRTGFPLIGDALFEPKYAGVEEVTTIALLQKIYPFLTAKLVEIEGVEWKTDSWDTERLEKHRKKMESKVQKAAEQMKIFGIPPPIIMHIRKTRF